MFVTCSFVSIQRPGHWAHNCIMAYRSRAQSFPFKSGAPSHPLSYGLERWTENQVILQWRLPVFWKWYTRVSSNLGLTELVPFPTVIRSNFPGREFLRRVFNLYIEHSIGVEFQRHFVACVAGVQRRNRRWNSGAQGQDLLTDPSPKIK